MKVRPDNSYESVDDFLGELPKSDLGAIAANELQERVNDLVDGNLNKSEGLKQQPNYASFKLKNPILNKPEEKVASLNLFDFEETTTSGSEAIVDNDQNPAPEWMSFYQELAKIEKEKYIKIPVESRIKIAKFLHEFTSKRHELTDKFISIPTKIKSPVNPDQFLPRGVMVNNKKAYIHLKCHDGAERLGKGFSKDVFETIQYDFDTAEMKILVHQKITKNELNETAVQEANTYQIFDHPNIVKLNDVLKYMSHKGRDRVVLYAEKCDGNLEQGYKHSGTQKTLSDGEKIQILKDIATAVQYLHEDHKICHADLKPDNFLIQVQPSGALLGKLSDFGTSKLEGETLELFCRRLVAPEQRYENHKTATFKADVYQFGISLWETFCPLASNLPKGQILPKKERFDKWDPNHHSEIRELCSKCLEENPEARPTFSEIISELGQIASQETMNNAKGTKDVLSENLVSQNQAL